MEFDTVKQSLPSWYLPVFEFLTFLLLIPNPLYPFLFLCYFFYVGVSQSLLYLFHVFTRISESNILALILTKAQCLISSRQSIHVCCMSEWTCMLMTARFYLYSWSLPDLLNKYYYSLLHISIWMQHKHLKLNMFRTGLIIFISKSWFLCLLSYLIPTYPPNCSIQRYRRHLNNHLIPHFAP